jgi:phosphatidylglycerophosphatase A
MTEEPESGIISRTLEEAQAKRARALNIQGPADTLAVLLATGLGVGFIPFASGTFGSFLGVAIFYALISAFKFKPDALLNSVLAASAVTAATGIWAAARAEKVFKQEDAGQIVIDEVCGQLISFALVAPYLVKIGSQWRWTLLVGFALFRLFDIFKPYPLRQMERLGAGLGVMADDVLAGIYAAVVLSLILFLMPVP